MAGGINGDPEPKGVKRKCEEPSITQEQHDSLSDNNGMHTDIPIVNTKVRCKFCHKTNTEDVCIPSSAAPECIVLTNEILANIYTDNDDVVQHNLTNYSIYDENGHMCSIDSGVMERNITIYMTGYVKPIYDNSPGIEEGIAARELGPILEWWLSSYDGGTQALIGINTEYADYLLIEPHPKYKKYMTSVTEKIHLSREVIKNILSSEYDDPTYEDILNCIINSVNPATGNKFTEEDLISHAQFVLNQVLEYDLNDTYHLPLAETQCIETLTQLSGAAKPVKALSRRAGQRNQYVKTDINKREFSKATTTELVKDVFENMFAAQLDIDDKENEGNVNKLVKTMFDDVCNSKIKKEISDIRVNVNQVLWRDQILCEKMFVVVKNNASTIPLIGCIEYFFKTKFKNNAHIQLFMHSYETVLGETADPQEIFSLKNCTNIDIKNVVRVLDVVQKIPSKNWFQLGNSKLQDLLEPINRKNKNSFFYQLQYDDKFGRFEYPKPLEPNTVITEGYCSNCEDFVLEQKSKEPELHEFIEQDKNISYFYKFKLFDEEYKVGSFIYLQPEIFKTASRSNMIGEEPFEFKKTNKNISNQEQKIIDETKYPEYYRKSLENTMRGSNETTPDPFEIAEILAIYFVDWDRKNIKLIVRRMYRAEQIPLEDYAKNSDMNMLFWSEEEFRVTYQNIRGKCYVSFISNIQDPLLWSSGGPDRFYFTKKYDFIFGSIVSEHELPSEAKLTGKEVYVNYKYQYVDENKLQYIPSYKKIKPLRGLDIFAGCGGLSRGLEDSGLVISNWAIECDDKAAGAFKLNNPEATVFVEDCNHLLKLAMSGEKTNSKNQNIPQKGEVDFICGGPPCQGFSGMNRFNSGQYSLFKNSLIVSFLSYIDFYRPKYFVMENVRNFVSFKRSMVLKLTLRCITRMGYQCTFGILQAGNFGVPQTRRRLIIMAAAPGEKLPLYPEPIHVFNRRSSSLTVQIGTKKFKTNCKYDESAPMRTVTVYDAWSDLPEIPNGANDEDIIYKSKPITHLQKLLRYPDNRYAESILSDHICKDMSSLVQARMALIPVCEGSDWRDLPNITVHLPEGLKTNKLLYTHHDIKNGYGPNGALRGVCMCASGDKCDPQDRQNNTIIPWCLPHTGNRHNNWAGLYGRLAWSGFCSTTITNPEPMGKQGRVLHPEQHRVVSVRECARSQGFKDSFIFHGPIINKHRQIGNAVPPPMGTAIGHEIIKAIDKKPRFIYSPFF
ncbi:DNA (cytosine-5)-methyltransferase 1-like [Metopolophium dirhodum]|uniref:DNA (cytosine-5)-methyltransferase 1-like n=1 Tax=Metopolophium dirhodum TaxID=44670 RepID=UPI0029907F14|nr:DNA (cytosine-5)-methyltransferase 1-like [Metopolophium dirhodum]XP_060863644.1 DNA (cytosine-5)-methyltransferase 1-like [Metopolophium dirhodum]